MKKNGLIIGLVSLAVVNTQQVSPVAAEDLNKSNSKKVESSAEIPEPTAQELKNSTDRALYIDPISHKSKKDTNTSAKKIKPKQKTTSKTKTARSKTKKKTKSSVAKKRSLYKIIPSNTKSRKLKARKKSKPAVKKASVKKKQSNITRVSYSSKSNIVAASLNRAGKVAHYKDGEQLMVSVKAYEDCNLMIFNFDGQKLTQIFPNEFQKNPFLKAGSKVVVGGANSKFDFVASNDANTPSNEKIFVYAYPVKEDNQPITIAMNRPASSPFRSTKMTLEEYRNLVNTSKTFFDRSVKVVGKDKSKNQLASFSKSDIPPNKLELSLVIHKR